MSSTRAGRPVLTRVRTRIRGALWPIPTLAVVLAIGVGVALPALDQALAQRPEGSPLTFAFGGGPAAARDLLAAIAGSLISVTGLTFSLTVVALQLASSQYSPRVLQTFVTDRTVQLTLAQLVATFVYALTVLRTVRTESASDLQTAFVPRLSITVAYVLTVVSVIALVLFLAHLSGMLRVETTLRDVHAEAGATVERELGARATEERTPDLPAGPGIPLPATASGFLVDVDEDRLVAAAVDARAVVLLAPRFGDSVVAGVPVAHAWPDGSGGELDLPRLQEAVAGSVDLHVERLPSRDIAYGLRKVVDVAVRAVSPGINDPTTAVHALAHASALLGDLLGHPLPAALHRDDDGVLRLVTTPWTAGDLLDLALEEPLQFASGQPAVLRRLAALLREVAWLARRGPLDLAMRRYLDRVVAIAADSTGVPDTERESWVLRFEQALAGRWPEDRPGTSGAAG